MENKIFTAPHADMTTFVHARCHGYPYGGMRPPPLNRKYSQAHLSHVRQCKLVRGVPKKFSIALIMFHSIYLQFHAFSAQMPNGHFEMICLSLQALCTFHIFKLFNGILRYAFTRVVYTGKFVMGSVGSICRRWFHFEMESIRPLVPF